MQIEMSEQQIKNAVALLGRVQLSGNEVPAFNELIDLLVKPTQEVKKEEKKK